MKKNKKHYFSHTDPEKISVPAKTGSKKSLATKSFSNEYGVIKKDLLRTVITIVFFVVVVVALYIIEQKTGLLKPILTKFGI